MKNFFFKLINISFLEAKIKLFVFFLFLAFFIACNNEGSDSKTPPVSVENGAPAKLGTVWSGPQTRIAFEGDKPKITINGNAISPIFLMLNAQSVDIQNHNWSIFDYQLDSAVRSGVQLIEVNLLNREESFIKELAKHLNSKNTYYLIRYDLYNPSGYLGERMKYLDAKGNSYLHSSFNTASESYIQAQIAESKKVLTLLDQNIPGKIAGVKFANYETGENFTYPITNQGQGPGTDGKLPWIDNFFYPDYGSDIAFQFCQWNILPAAAKTNCSLPSPAIRSRPNLGTLLISGKDPDSLRSIYLNRYHAIRIVNGLKKIATAIKEQTNQMALVSVFYGYLYSLDWNMSGSGHIAMKQLLEEPAIDAISAPYSYRNSRNLGLAMAPHGPDASLTLHKKLWIHEDDTRTHIEELRCGGVPGCSKEEPPDIMKAHSLADSQKFLRRNAFSAALRGNALYYMNLWNKGWYGHPSFPADSQALWNTIKEIRRVISEVKTDGGYQAEIAVFVDEVSGSHFPINGFGGANSWDFSNKFLGGIIDDLASIGAPIQHYLLSDITNAAFPSDRIKFAIFLNAFHMTAEVRAAVSSKLKRGNKTLLYLYAPALINDSEQEVVSQVSEELGMSVSLGKGSIPLLTRVEATKGNGVSTNSPTPSQRGVLYYGTSYEVSPWFHVTDVTSTILGRYNLNNLNALAVKSFNSYKVIFSGAPGLPANLIRQWATEANVHFFTKSEGDPVEAAGRAVAIHAKSSREKNISLPFKVDKLTSNTLNGDQVLCTSCSQANIYLAQGETTLLRWTSSLDGSGGGGGGVTS